MGWRDFVGDAGRIVGPDSAGVLHSPTGDR
jgi:hypothetical protein